LQRVDCLICGWETIVDVILLDALPALRYLSLRCTSTKNVELSAVSERAIRITTIAEYGDPATAEFVVRQLLESAANNFRELGGCEVGLIGFGAVGKRVADLVHAFGASVSYCNGSGKPASSTFARHKSLYDILANSELISFHSPAYLKVLEAADWKDLNGNVLAMVVTTLGLPFEFNDFLLTKNSRLQLILDGCALAENVPAIQVERVRFFKIPSARSKDSIRRAGDYVLNNMMREVEVVNG